MHALYNIVHVCKHISLVVCIFVKCRAPLDISAIELNGLPCELNKVYYHHYFSVSDHLRLFLESTYYCFLGNLLKATRLHVAFIYKIIVLI